MKMDDSIPSDVPDDDRALGPLLGTLPPEILDVVVKKLGWFQTTFAMAGRTCREAVERVSSPRAVVLTEEELERMNISGIRDLDGPLMTAAADGDLQALAWVIERFEKEGAWTGARNTARRSLMWPPSAATSSASSSSSIFKECTGTGVSGTSTRAS